MLKPHLVILLMAFLVLPFFYFIAVGKPKAIGCPNGNFGNLNCDSSSLINEADLSILLGSWATNGPVPTPPAGQSSADLDHNGKIDERDLSILLGHWNTTAITPTPTSPPSPTVTQPPTPTITAPPLGTPTPPQGNYPRPPARNYVYYDWSNGNWNTQYPRGAPWGGVYVFSWKDLHTGPGQFNWGLIDNYLVRAATINKSVLLKLSIYESALGLVVDRSLIPSSYTCPAGSGQDIWPVWYDLTPAWVRNQTGGSYIIPLNDAEGAPGHVGEPCRQGGPQNPDPRYCWGVATMPKYGAPQYQTALKEMIQAMGARYNNDPRVAGVIFGAGIDNEFGHYTKNWGACGIKEKAARLGYVGNYLSLFVNSTEDYTDWYANAFPDKPVYHTLTSDGKTRAAVMMAKGHLNLGIHQASLAADHNWFHTSANDGILDIIMPWIGRRPIGWENAFVVRDLPSGTAAQNSYKMMLAMVHTFPDFLDFVQGFCFNHINECTWARQYYGRTPTDTNDVWIAFQESDFWPPRGGASIQFSGWPRDYEYGLDLKSTKGFTMRRQNYTNDWISAGYQYGPGLKETFNQQVADAYSGQGRRVDVNETMLLEPRAEWKGIAAGTTPNYELAITLIDNSGHVKVEVGNNADGWSTLEWDRTNQVNWQVKTFNVDKKAKQIKITPTGAPLYLHMVKLSLRS